MYSMSLLCHSQAQEADTAASCFAKRQLPRQWERAAALHRSQVIVLLAVCVLVSLASRTFAQVQEIIPSNLSSALLEATAAQTPAVQSVFDAARLPPIESIGPGSDIRPFLDPGVPQNLTRAALRRAWATDPTIRDFIGLSENSWDFNAPDSARRQPTEEADNRLLSGSDKSATSLDKSGR
jgi:hypothetical protein